MIMNKEDTNIMKDQVRKLAQCIPLKEGYKEVEEFIGDHIYHCRHTYEYEDYRFLDYGGEDSFGKWGRFECSAGVVPMYLDIMIRKETKEETKEEDMRKHAEHLRVKYPLKEGFKEVLEFVPGRIYYNRCESLDPYRFIREAPHNRGGVFEDIETNREVTFFLPAFVEKIEENDCPSSSCLTFTFDVSM